MTKNRFQKIVVDNLNKIQRIGVFDNSISRYHAQHSAIKIVWSNRIGDASVIKSFKGSVDCEKAKIELAKYENWFKEFQNVKEQP